MYIRKTIVVTFLIFLLLTLFSDRVLPIYHSKNGSNSLLEPLVLEEQGFLVEKGGFLKSIDIPHYKPQVLASYKEPKWKQVIECESKWKHYNENGYLLEGDQHLPIKAYGIAQFQKRTFVELKNKAGRPELRIENKDDQIWLLKWAIKNGYGYKWSCY